MSDTPLDMIIEGFFWEDRLEERLLTYSTASFLLPHRLPSLSLLEWMKKLASEIGTDVFPILSEAGIAWQFIALMDYLHIHTTNKRIHILCPHLNIIGRITFAAGNSMGMDEHAIIILRNDLLKWLVKRKPHATLFYWPGGRLGDYGSWALVDVYREALPDLWM